MYWARTSCGINWQCSTDIWKMQVKQGKVLLHVLNCNTEIAGDCKRQKPLCTGYSTNVWCFTILPFE